MEGFTTKLFQRLIQQLCIFLNSKSWSKMLLYILIYTLYITHCLFSKILPCLIFCLHYHIFSLITVVHGSVQCKLLDVSLRTLVNYVMAPTNSTHVKFIEGCVRDCFLWIRSIWGKMADPFEQKWGNKSSIQSCRSSYHHCSKLPVKAQKGAPPQRWMFSFLLRWPCCVQNADLVKECSESITCDRRIF